jgi:hypothetical protein
MRTLEKERLMTISYLAVELSLAVLLYMTL